MNDGQIAIIKRDSYKIEGNAELKAISFTKDEVSKGAFPTYMLKEIFEQEKAVRMALSGKSNFGRLKLIKEQINKGNAEYGLGDIGSINVSYMKKVKRIALIGAGTSYHACLLGSYLFNSINDFEAHAFLSSEAIKTIKPHYDLYIFISQSGETADTIEVLRQVNKMGKPTFGICNVPGSTIAEETMGGKFTYAGPELSVASTKSFTTQLAVLYLMYLYFKAVNNIDVEQELKELERLPEKIGKCIMENDKKAKDLAYEIGNSNYLIYIGRNLYYPIALEGALKMKEIAYIPCIAYAGGELKHGPLALVNENTNVIAINPENEAKHEMESNIKEVEARRGNIILISDHNANFNLPKTMPVFYPILSILPLQLLAHHTATIKGNNIDKPRNLAKSVTVK
ncbi:MAG: SIS domain-containing protein [Candidatus Anstonellales archaeon]